MTVLVTGGAGFIGSHLVDSLVARGEQVRILDDMSNGRERNLNRAAELLIGDVADKAAVAEAAKGCGTIFHLASRRAVAQSIKHPMEVNETNVGGTLTVLEVARRQQIPRVIIASSSSVYGAVTQVPTPETAPLVPRSPYAVSKLAAELYARVYAQLFSMETVCLRYFNVYGPRQDTGDPYAAVIPLFLEALSHDRSPVIFGDGNQTRAFTYVDDAVSATLAAAGAAAWRVGGRVYNAAGTRTCSINELLRHLQEISGTTCTARHTEPRDGDIRRSEPDLSAALHDLGWYPQVDLPEGLSRTADAFLNASHPRPPSAEPGAGSATDPPCPQPANPTRSGGAISPELAPADPATGRR